MPLFIFSKVNNGNDFITFISLLATSWEELTHWKRLWCWEGLGARGKGDDRGWDGWMASPTRCTWVWVNSRSWWWTGRPGMVRFMGSQRVGHNWVTELNWTELNKLYSLFQFHFFLKSVVLFDIHMFKTKGNISFTDNWCLNCYSLE